MEEKKITVFCASSSEIDSQYKAAARELVRALHALGYTLVSGGGECGLMGEIIRESAACGGRHIGILPGFMKGLESASLGGVVWTDTMSARKEKMREGTCAAIALPGGIGTLDELMETHTLRKLGKYEGEVFALNINGFYDPLITLLQHFAKEGMMSREDMLLLHFPRTVEELVASLS